MFMQLCAEGKEDVRSILPNPFYDMKMFVHPIEHKPKSLLLLSQIHISKLAKWLFIGFMCQTLILTVFIIHIYLFLSRCVWLRNNILVTLKFPHVYLVFCCSTDGKRRGG